MTIYIQFILFISNRVWSEKKTMVCRSEKNNNFFASKIYFDAASSCFLCYINLFLLTWNTISCNINTFLSKQNYFLCNAKLFILTQNYFLCNTKFLFWTSFMMLCHGDIFLWSHSSKNKITCQKINKLSFLCETKKLILFFVHHHFFIFIFYYYTLPACWSSS